MKLHTTAEVLLLTALTLSSTGAFAYGNDKEKEICRHPKVQEFTLPEYQGENKKEVAAESEFSFIVSGWADPKKIKMDGKGVPVPITVESNDNYHKVKGKLPPELTGKFVRLNARVPAVLGCYTTIGWLIKVADKAKTPDAATPEATRVPQSVETGAKAAIPSGEAVAPADKAVTAP